MDQLQSRRKQFKVCIRRAKIKQIMEQKRENFVKDYYMNEFYQYLRTLNQDSSTIFQTIYTKFQSLSEYEKGIMACQIWNILNDKNFLNNSEICCKGLGILLSQTFLYLNIDKKTLQSYWKPQYLRILLQQLWQNIQGNQQVNEALYDFAYKITEFQHFKKKIQMKQNIVQNIIDKVSQVQSYNYFQILYLLMININEDNIRKVYKRKLIQLGRILYLIYIDEREDTIYENLLLLIGYHCTYPRQYSYIVDALIKNIDNQYNYSLKIRFLSSQIQVNYFHYNQISSFLSQYYNSLYFFKSKEDTKCFLSVILQFLNSHNEEDLIKIYEEFFGQKRIQKFLQPYYTILISKIIYTLLHLKQKKIQNELLYYAKLCLIEGNVVLAKHTKTYFCYRLIISNQLQFDELDEFLTYKEIDIFWDQYEKNNNLNDDEN